MLAGIVGWKNTQPPNCIQQVIIDPMSDTPHHSRRDFLQGKAAARTLAERAFDWAQQWVGSATELIADRFPEQPTLHLEARRRAMACEFAVRYHEADRHLADAVLEAFDEIDRIESLLTIYRDTSLVLDLNRMAAAGPVLLDPELFQLIELAAKLHGETHGAFDITATPLSRVWGFLKREGRLPSNEEIAEALELVDMSRVLLNSANHSVQFRYSGIEINFNALGKGYALDRAASLLAERGADNYLWHGGRSSVLARGANRGDDHNAWSIGLRNPLEPQSYLAEFHLRNRALGTSGGATQFFEHEGQRYSHIIDPRTGWPESGVYTATVIAPTAAEADAFSTAVFVLGPEHISPLLAKRPDIAVALVCPSDADSGMTVFLGNMADDDWTPLCERSMITVV
jgi:thiamine biosynthesis lipoprotein